MDQILQTLTTSRNNLASLDYSSIYQLIADLRNKAIPTALLHKDWYIDRVRINIPGEIFTNINQVSYINDQDILNAHVTFGRANEPSQAVFYGSIISHEIDVPRAVAYFETSQLLKELDQHYNANEIFTVSRWRIIKNIEILEMMFSDEGLKSNQYCRLAYDNQIKKIKGLEHEVHYKEQCKFFSNEYARSDISRGEEFKYKISAGYSNYIWRNTHLRGVTYPSVASKFAGQNVALLPEIVDQYLELDKVIMFKFEKRDGINLPIDSLKIATDLGKDKMNFKWYDFSGVKK